MKEKEKKKKEKYKKWRINKIKNISRKTNIIY